MPARRTANRFRERTQHQVVNWRRFSVYAWRVRPLVPGQEPGEGEPSGVGEGGLDRDEGSGWGGSGHRVPPGQGQDPGGWASCGSQRLSGNST